MKLVENKNGLPITDSKKVAETFQKNHRDVMTDIRKLLKSSGDFGERNFSLSSYISKQNKKLPCYEMTKDGFTLLGMGYGTKKALEFKIKYIQQFNEMESLIRKGGNLLTQINEATLDMETDKNIASKCGSTLSIWRRKKVDHLDKIECLMKESQLILDLL